MDLGLLGKVALVGASTGGIGRGIARALHAEGALVVVTGRRHEAVEDAVAELPGAVGLTVDLAQHHEVATLNSRVEDLVGPVDIVVLNGGGPPPGPAAAMTDEGLVDALELLVRGHRQLVGDVLPGMRMRGWGRIIGVGSSGVVEPLPELAASNVGRAALSAYLKSLAVTIAADGITCNMILPGRIDTDRVRSMDQHRARLTGRRLDEYVDAAQGAIPARRYGTPDEFGAVAAFLCSEQASYVTGTQVRVDGGLTHSY
jgi:3-oxoacyl-[acyl-carrier protein] reductase